METPIDRPLLWHIPLSHYSEKVRWALDYKGIPHRRRVLGPNYLIRAWRATGQGKLPVLWLEGQAVGDSTRIIAALEARYPQPGLYPEDDARRRQALALEDDLDEQLGPALRAAIIGPMLRHDPEIALRIITTGMPEQAYNTLRPMLKLFPAYYRFRHGIRDAKLQVDRAAVLAALERIERERQGHAYLVGETFTVADLTAAAMLSPLLQPAEIQYPIRVELPTYIRDFRSALLEHPAMRWAAGIYREHRGRSAEVGKSPPVALP
jgi:glutathione S-transferase